MGMIVGIVWQHIFVCEKLKKLDMECSRKVKSLGFLRES
jgi:hypothetical protein